MSLEHMKSGEVIDLNNLGPELGGKLSVSLLRSEGLQLLRLVLAPGEALPDHRVDGEITVQCLKGRVTFDVGESSHVMGPGTLIHLKGGQVHAVTAIENAVLLLTVSHLTPDKGA